MGKTAAEFLAELENDPDWVARREAARRSQESASSEFALDEQQMVAELASVGVAVSSVWDLVHRVNDYQAAYPVLLRHLTISHHPKTREGIIRSLTVKDGGTEVEQALLAEFEKESDASLRWVIANALKTTIAWHRRKKYPEVMAVWKQR